MKMKMTFCSEEAMERQAEYAKHGEDLYKKRLMEKELNNAKKKILKEKKK